MIRPASLTLLTLLTVGCPEPVATNEGAMSPTAGGGGAAGGQPPVGGAGAAGGQAPAGGAGAAGGQPAGGMTAGGQLPNGTEVPTAGTFGSIVPDAELEPRFAQADLTEGSVVSGTTACADCEGKILLRVLPPPPDQGGTDEEIHLVTVKSYDKAGAFDIRIPKEYDQIVLQVVDDTNGDGKPSSGERMGIASGGPLDVSSNVSGIELTVGVFPDQPAMDGTGNVMQNAPQGGAEAAKQGPNPGEAGAQAAAGGEGGTPEGPPPDGAPPQVEANPGEAGPPPEVAGTPPTGG